MTPEEAGQLILEDKPFRPCEACEGEGRVLIEVRTELIKGKPAIEIETYQVCTVCNDTGKMLTADYAQACGMVGREFPSPPPRKRKRPPTLKKLVDIKPDPGVKPLKLDFGGLYKKGLI